jgi:hypothetical protein
MSLDRVHAAQELYALEALRPFTAEQLHRWQTLAEVVFPGALLSGQRTSPRLSGQAAVQIYGATLTIADVSWGGLCVKGDAAGSLRPGEEVKLDAIRADPAGDWRKVDLRCRVSFVRDGAAGLALLELDSRRRHDYFVHAYYPLYMDHLRTIADGTPPA